jgi:hypothetical protein
MLRYTVKIMEEFDAQNGRRRTTIEGYRKKIPTSLSLILP